MNKIIVYHERLGDILRCVPLAKHFWAQGYRVFIECLPAYHDLGGNLLFCDLVAPGEAPEGERIDLQIWPHRFKEFTESGLNWMDFVYRDYPDVPRQIDLSYNAGDTPPWVDEAVLVFPNGYSQRNPPNPRAVILQAHKLFPGRPVCVIGKADLGCHELPTIGELIDWIAAAKHVLTVNTAASIIASAVRSSWHHIPDLDPQHDFTHPNQIRVGRVA
jgi:UDP:flavonoid glycosyltransferase YjiC (YdhE family)